MEKKYRTEKEGNMLRIIALKDFSDVKEGDKGGLIETRDNLSQEGDCWVYEDAWVKDNARVCGNAKVYGDAIVKGYSKVSGNAEIFGRARICDSAEVSDNAKVYGSAEVFGTARVYGNARVGGRIMAWLWANIGGNVKLWSPRTYYISNSIENNKDYIILAIKREFRIISFSNIDKDLVEEVYIKNIKTIRQLYGKEV